VSIVYCRCAYCFPETTRGKITRHYARFCAVEFCYVHKCELSYIYPGHDVKLYQQSEIINIEKSVWDLAIGEGANVLISK